MITMRDFMVAEEQRNDLLREAETERLIGKNPSMLQIRLHRLLVHFSESMQAKFIDTKSKATIDKADTGQLAHGHR